MNANHTKPNFDELETRILGWAIDRRIIPNASPTSQLLKAFSEMGELADGYNKGRPDEVRDAIGDVLVCLINFCALSGLDMTNCLEHAYNEIKDRKGTMLPSGVFVKEGDVGLQVAKKVVTP